MYFSPSKKKSSLSTMDFPTIIKQISECYIKPKYEVEESKQPYNLSPWDLALLCVHYNQKGLLFSTAKLQQDPNFQIDNLIDSLKHSLSLTLVHFYPLAGQFVTTIDTDRNRSIVYVNCNKGPGVRFIHAGYSATVSDIVSQDSHVPLVVNSFFDLNNGEVNHDGHTMPLLSVKVTELADGLFIGCSMNHVIVDGTSFWHFWNVWSKIHCQKEDVSIFDKPIHKRWVPDGYTSDDVFFPWINTDKFITRFQPPENLRERFFHFSSESIAQLKTKANQGLRSVLDSNRDNGKFQNDQAPMISSFQALMALVWKAIIKAQDLQRDQVTHCNIIVNNRTRLNPPLPRQYFGNSIGMAQATTTVGELVDHNLGWAALVLNQTIAKQTKETFVLDFCKQWFDSPTVYQLQSVFQPGTVQVGSSPRFDVYGNEFDGLGRPVAVRSGRANKFGGKVIMFPGQNQDDGSIDGEICLPYHTMKILEGDEQFMSFVSLHATEL